MCSHRLRLPLPAHGCRFMWFLLMHGCHWMRPLLARGRCLDVAATCATVASVVAMVALCCCGADTLPGVAAAATRSTVAVLQLPLVLHSDR
ncbi:hypothetical protein B296_00051525 [Ensete ventricosum]|uniref:Uncharacterized protein n=1 Tax=Ensete ventricosum TaxID=4639 RepID=A0A426YGH0_ENSVE|nr:hypothetical protein B296_00051525 [Ensete ventricosum]